MRNPVIEDGKNRKKINYDDDAFVRRKVIDNKWLPPLSLTKKEFEQIVKNSIRKSQMQIDVNCNRMSDKSSKSFISQVVPLYTPQISEMLNVGVGVNYYNQQNGPTLPYLMTETPQQEEPKIKNIKTEYMNDMEIPVLGDIDIDMNGQNDNIKNDDKENINIMNMININTKTNTNNRIQFIPRSFCTFKFD